MAQLKCLVLLLEKMCQIPRRCGETEKRSGVKHHCDGHCCIAQFKLSETQREKEENTNQETPSTWKGCCRTFRAISALPCRAGADNTPTQNSLYGNTTFGHSSHLKALTHLTVVKMWAGLVLFFKKSYLKEAFAMMMIISFTHRVEIALSWPQN